ncbi:hypothetical protein ANCCAN_27564 [Ancylostoma caninum]|uniref:Uncharacterized protein n=1 Tax=Ancylostoma caninum TaxID=29170 RepID=A0A368F6P6_ANCCA|nr:hypothetical protein ANCCAN_27564 [Ancylostoma caninum]
MFHDYPSLFYHPLGGNARIFLETFIGMDSGTSTVQHTIDLCVKEVERLRELSPLWEMVQEGIDLKSIQWTQH